MDALAVTAGAAVGAVSGFVPGLHTNLIAALVVAAGAVDPSVVPLLLAAAGAHAVSCFLPSLWGAPAEPQAGTVLPAHRLVAAGRGRDALAASVIGSLVGVAVGVPLALGAGFALAGGGYDRIRPVVAPLVLAAWCALVVTEPTWRRRGLAAVVALAAGALGVAALGVPVSSPFGLPASVLLPLLSGLFALPVLSRVVPAAVAPARRAGRVVVGRGPFVGAALALPAAVLPGFTSGPATALAMSVGRRARATQAVATAAAVNSAVTLIATTVLHAAGRARSGVHVAAASLAEYPTAGPFLQPAMAHDLAAVAWGCLVGAGALLLAARALERASGGSVVVLARASLVVIVALTFATTGLPGLGVLAAATIAGELPERLGVRRSQLMACLMLPVVWRAVAGG